MARPTVFSKAMVSLLLVHAACSDAIDLGVMGKRYAFAEEDYYEVLMAKVSAAQQAGVFAEAMDQQKNRIKAYLQRPSGILLPPAQEDTVHFVDPTYRLEQDIVDEQGKVLYPSGFTFNPLHYMSWDKRFCFIDADSEAQVAWADRICPLKNRDRIVLVNGEFMATQRRLQRQLYFDQYGKISGRFGLQALPALAFQQGDLIRVESYALE